MENNDLTPSELSGWLEFACWTTVAMAPFLYWVNGPVVSTDQLVVRTTLVTLALVGGLSLRVAKLIRRKA